MLQRLSIQNYAIIDELEINFSERLNIITGETGAGKSIIVGALGLILGERADNTALVNKEKKCVVEGFFHAGSKKQVREFLRSHELDEYDELVVRREIGTTGKSRAFINDTPATLVQLQELSSLLVDLHQQFDTLALGKNDFQRDVVDALAGHAGLLQEYQQAFRRWQTAMEEWEKLKEQKLAFDKEYDYNQFQFNELEEAGFKENELEDIDTELKRLSHAEGIKAVLAGISHTLQESESPVVQQLKSVVHQVSGYSSYHPGLPSLVSRLQSAQIELQDIAEEVERIGSHIRYDPEKIEQYNERLSAGYRLQKKHGVQTTHELLQIRDELAKKLQAVLQIEEQIQVAEKETERWFEEAKRIAAAVSEGRRKQVKPLESRVNRLLAQVGMPNARLKVEIIQGGLTISGSDTIEFLFDANLPTGQAGKSGQFQPVRKVASGGELSRLMLSLKSLVAQSIDLPTLIFDEIDTGISGEAARQVGIIMKELAAKRQVISITHQPQIAGRADAHFFVYKEIVNDASPGDPVGRAVKTSIRRLSTEERITAIAKMLSGEKPTTAAMENAREMVSN